MMFKPNIHQLETIAVLDHARAPVGKIATVLGFTPEEFSAWAGRLVAARALDVAVYRKPMPAPTPAPAATVTNPRIVADRLFECYPATKRLQP